MSRRRLVHAGNVIADVAMAVPALPEPGSDVLATRSEVSAGAGFNVMAAAARLGMPVVHAGAHGTGPFGELVRTAMAAEGIEVAGPQRTDLDTGFCVALVDDTGERTFVTRSGAEGTTGLHDLTSVTVGAADLVHVSGYALLADVTGPALVEWLSLVPPTATVLVDPQPLVARIPVDRLRAAQRRADWWTCNEQEAAALTGETDPERAARALARACPRATVLVRTGPRGCVLLQPGGRPEVVPGFAVRAVDTNGAGDAHVGALVASLGAGLDVAAAVRRANAAAALATTRFGPATAPTAAQLAGALAGRTSDGDGGTVPG